MVKHRSLLLEEQISPQIELVNADPSERMG